MLPPPVADALAGGGVIPAHPLALAPDRRLDERRQRALTRYYIDAGAAGVAVGVHTTQFAIRQAGLLAPVLALAREVIDSAEARPAARGSRPPLIRIAGVCGPTAQAVGEARLARDLGYHLGLLSLAALPRASDDELLAHAAAVAEVLPIMGFYLQPAVGGRPLGRAFWARFAQLPAVLAIKVAPFDRYRTLDVIHGLRDSGRAPEVALYTGNDDNIVGDLVTPFDSGENASTPPRSPGAGSAAPLRFVGGLLGQWAVWTRRAVELVDRIRTLRETGAPVPPDLLRLGAALTDANAALFDAANHFHGCIPGIHESLRRQGLLADVTCLDPAETLSPGQRDEIDRIWAAYPHLRDDDFVRENLTRWLTP